MKANEISKKCYPSFQCENKICRNGKCRNKLCTSDDKCGGEDEDTALDIYYCTDDDHCLGSSFCNSNGGCVLDRAVTEECNRDDQCGAGYCTAGGKCDHKQPNGVDCSRDEKVRAL